MMITTDRAAEVMLDVISAGDGNPRLDRNCTDVLAAAEMLRERRSRPGSRCDGRRQLPKTFPFCTRQLSPLVLIEHISTSPPVTMLCTLVKPAPPAFPDITWALQL